ncbi:ribonuclease T2 family protein [Aestuariivirga sp.]|uniref:ribonuclease T2 family protein n=1 Tax=Aestuariivirga sp. TaxID=2650926 RepID=UPI003BA99DB9
MRVFRHLIVTGVAALLFYGKALADEPLDGQFLASRACPALLSIRKDTNPGRVITAPGVSYRLLARNRKQATHYRIEMPDAVPPERWVEAECGRARIAKGEAAAPAAQTPSYVLALSWQPAFCETNGKKPECRWQTGDRFDANYFSLHGLWPQPSTREYCKVDTALRSASEGGKWKDLPDLDLSLSTRTELETMMPGSKSMLERHEWAKHGTCYPASDPERYFRDALRLLKAVNGTGLPNLMMAETGRSVTTNQIRAQFDEAFGAGAGERVRVACKDDGNRRLISEITIGLRGDIPGGTPLAELIMASPPTDPGCPGGVVDPVGPQ